MRSWRSPAPDGFLDLYVNEGLALMVDDSLVYMRGFGATPTDISSPNPSLRISPQVFLADGRLISSRSYPLGAPEPEDGRPDPLSEHPILPGEYLIRREYWASFFPDRTIVAETGSTIRLRVHNRLQQSHALRIDGVASTGPDRSGGDRVAGVCGSPTRHLRLHDPGGGSVERILGLHGVPRGRLAERPVEARTLGLPSSSGSGSGCARTSTRSGRARARAGEVIDPVATPPVPRYFMLNDQSGFRSLGMSRDTARQPHPPRGHPSVRLGARS